MKILFFLLISSLIGYATCISLHQNPFYKNFKKVSDNAYDEIIDKTNNNLNEKNKNSNIKNAQNLFMCINDRCYSIQEYKILPENYFSCLEKNIFIELSSLKKYNLTEENKEIVGYLTESRTIVESQEMYTFCKRIKRYFFFNLICFYILLYLKIFLFQDTT